MKFIMKSLETKEQELGQNIWNIWLDKKMKDKIPNHDALENWMQVEKSKLLAKYDVASLAEVRTILEAKLIRYEETGEL